MTNMQDKLRQGFYETLWGYYESHGRHDLPWRQPEAADTFDPYKVMVSEIMLQQTQVGRVIPKYQAFLEKFPTIATLSQAELGEVLRAWQGLGYNRRAKFLRQAAQKVTNEYDGVMPNTETELIKLPGIGKNTAGAILAYAFNKPAIFIETNIRTVYIHHFFADTSGVDDKEILDIVAKTIDTQQPRIFYWALMDYGTYLKQTQGNLNKLSKTYTKQSKFHGSKRQIRGAVVRRLSTGPQSYEQLQEVVLDQRLNAVLADLLAEGLISKQNAIYTL
jgi:A/G-specific adenine glycosylase